MSNIIKNSFFYLVSRIISLICSFFSAILLGRFLGVDNYGIYGFAVSVGSIFVVLLSMGARNYITREIIKKKKNINKFIGNLLGLKSLILLFLEIILLGYIYLNNFNRITNLVLLVIVNTVFFNSFLLIFFSMNRAREFFKIEIINQIIISFLTLCGYYIILHNKGGLVLIILWLLFLSVIQNLII